MKKHGPFKQVSSKQVYKNPWISVREDKVVRPDGSDGLFGVIEYNPGVVVVAIDEHGNVVLNKEYKYGVDDYIYEVPTGGLKPGQTPLEAAKQELLEEAGVTAKTWQSLGSVHPLTTILENAKIEMFLATELSHGQPNHNSGDDIEVIEKVIIPYSEALKMVEDSQITFAPACVALLKAKKFVDPKYLK